jgi:hypothetical protein
VFSFIAANRPIVAPPAHAVVLSVDDKSQIQALDRSEPGLPISKGVCVLAQASALHEIGLRASIQNTIRAYSLAASWRWPDCWSHGISLLRCIPTRVRSSTGCLLSFPVA